jgi:hypothetical protein
MKRLAIVFLLGILGCGEGSLQQNDQPSGLAWRPDLSQLPPGPRHVSWFPMDLPALDVGIGANGALWIIGGNRRAAKWLPGTGSWLSINDAPGGGLARIAVDPTGVPWVIDVAHAIYRRSAGGWEQLPGTALDIGIGANGDVWRITSSGVSKYLADQNTWQPMLDGIIGVRIAVAPDGSPWVVGPTGDLSHWEDGEWKRIAQHMRDVGVGSNGSVWTYQIDEIAPAGHIINEVAPPNQPLWTADWGTDDWTLATSIAVDPTGHPFVTTDVRGLMAPFGGDCGFEGAACCQYDPEAHGCAAWLACTGGVCSN